MKIVQVCKHCGTANQVRIADAVENKLSVVFCLACDARFWKRAGYLTWSAQGISEVWVDKPNNDWTEAVNGIRRAGVSSPTTGNVVRYLIKQAKLLWRGEGYLTHTNM